METDNFSDDYSDDDQLAKYADDLAKVYKSEKQKRKELEVANKCCGQVKTDTLF